MKRDDAKLMVERELNSDRTPSDDGPLVVLDKYTQEKPYGWIFTVNTRKFAETGDLLKSAIGIGPVVFVTEDKSIHILGSGCDKAEEIAEFERRFIK